MTETFNAGDKVRATSAGGDEHIGIVTVFGATKFLGKDELSRPISFYISKGWTLELVEKAKPQLPTESGSVVKFAGVVTVFQLVDELWMTTGRIVEYTPASLLDRFGRDFEVYEAKGE